jgi:hypothetical protein
MTFLRKIASLDDLIRENKRIRLICRCGHVSEPSVDKLLGELNKLGGWRSDLKDLNKNLRCFECGEKRFRYEVID